MTALYLYPLVVKPVVLPGKHFPVILASRPRNPRIESSKQNLPSVFIDSIALPSYGARPAFLALFAY